MAFFEENTWIRVIGNDWKFRYIKTSIITYLHVAFWGERNEVYVATRQEMYV